MDINFESVTGEDFQVQALYDLLNNRVHVISHDTTPSFVDHKNFVLRNPYRLWYLVKSSTEYIGSVYLKSDNSVGLNLKYVNLQVVRQVIKFLQENITPMKPQASMVPNYFYVNVSASNIELIDILDQIVGKKMQISYKIGEDSDENK